MLALPVWLVVACGPSGEPPASRVEGRRWLADELALSVEFPEGWVIALDPAHHRSELSGVLLEGRSEPGLSLAVTWHALPDSRAVERLLADTTALDLLELVLPAPGAGLDAGYRLERLPRCDGAVRRVLIGGDGLPLEQVAVRAPGGLVVFHSWSDDGQPPDDRVRELVCARDTKP